MSKQPPEPGYNVVAMPAKPAKNGMPAKPAENRGSAKPAESRMAAKPAKSRDSARDFTFGPPAPAQLATAGTADDPRMKEAMRLMEAFLAIEDVSGRAALITLAESLVSFDWARKARHR